MKKYFMSRMISVCVFICLGFIVLSLSSAFNVCYAIGDKIDASKLKDYYLEYNSTIKCSSIGISMSSLAGSATILPFNSSGLTSNHLTVLPL